MIIRNTTLILGALSCLAAPVAMPSQAAAQPVTLPADETCRNFDWLLGTWSSYSPWGDRTAPTGGTLVFTSGPGGSVVGRIGSLNSDMEENGYQSGMVVFRGFSEVRSYGPTGTTRFESFGGEYLQLDDGASQWRGESIGVRQNGELYISPPAISRLSGHGPFRKASGTVSGDPCAPAEEPSEEVAAAFDDSALLRKIIEREDELPPVILNPDTCPVGSTTQSPSFETALGEAEKELRRLAERENRILASGEIADLAFTEKLQELTDHLDALILAQMFDPSAERRAQYAAQAEALLRVVQQDYGLDKAFVPELEGAPEAAGEECNAPFPKVVVDIAKAFPPPTLAYEPDQDPELQVLSVRNDVQGIIPDLYYGEDEETRLATMREALAALKTMDEDGEGDGPVRANMRRLFDQRFDRLKQEYIAARELARADDVTPDQAAAYSSQADRLYQQIQEFKSQGVIEDVDVYDALRLIEAPSGDGDDVIDLSVIRVKPLETYGRTADQIEGSTAGRTIDHLLDLAYGDGGEIPQDTNNILPRIE